MAAGLFPLAHFLSPEFPCMHFLGRKSFSRHTFFGREFKFVLELCIFFNQILFFHFDIILHFV